MGILHIIRIMRFQMDFQIFVGFVVNTTDAAFEIFVAFMGAHMAINQKARREILPTDLATVKRRRKIPSIFWVFCYNVTFHIKILLLLFHKVFQSKNLELDIMKQSETKTIYIE